MKSIQNLKDCAFGVGSGLLFGATLAAVGFAEFNQLHLMLTAQKLRLLWTFCLAVAVAGVAFRLWKGSRALPERRIHRGTVVGAILFGTGWALTGACPAVVWVQLGQGHVYALITLGGIIAGNLLYAFVQRRYLRWPSESCEGPN